MKKIFITTVFTLLGFSSLAVASCDSTDHLLRAQVCECSNSILVKCHSDSCSSENIQLSCQGEKIANHKGGALKTGSVVMLYDKIGHKTP